MILVIDNRDSFTFNIVQALAQLDADVEVRRGNEITADAVRRIAPQRILLGPGPGRADELETNVEVIRGCGRDIPMLGICLGHQAIGHAFGAELVSAPELVHGRSVEVRHDGHGVFRGLPPSVAFARYNSLSIREATLPACLEVSARSADGDVMGLRHTSWPLEGVQFHPDSILSPQGPALFANFLRSGG